MNIELFDIKIRAVEGGVTAAAGFKATGIHAGFRKNPERLDYALVVPDKPCPGAGVFTTNRFCAAPVQVSRANLGGADKGYGLIAGVSVNSGNANAATGETGLACARETCSIASQVIGCEPQQILGASTGVIGQILPIDTFETAIPAAYEALSAHGGADAARAIMTTDTHSKEYAVSYVSEAAGHTGNAYTVGGMCKGSGMIHPNMCTMLGFITSDVDISKELLQEALSEDIKDTYNMVSVDGDTSTNDTVLLLANGQAGNPKITEKNADYEEFKKALNYVNTTLAKKIAGDGEGATALFEVKVIGAATKAEAVTLSKSVVTSSLTKAAIYGHDANWGRILCALGYSGVQFDPEKVDLYFESKAGKIKIIENGVSTGYSEEEATKILSEEAVTAIEDMKMGHASATAWGCDLTYDYIKINADYRS